jgi:hypothetical protein
MEYADADQFEVDRSAKPSDLDNILFNSNCAGTDPIRFNDTLIYTENLQKCMIGLLRRILSQGVERSSPDG